MLQRKALHTLIESMLAHEAVERCLTVLLDCDLGLKVGGEVYARV